MRIFVTGGGGFLGRRLVAALRAAGANVDAPSSQELDLTSDRGLDAFPDAAYARIYHLAVWTRAGRFCRERGGDQWVVNSRINTNVLDWWQSRQPQATLVAFGTSASYTGSGLHHEEDYLAGVPSDDYFAYAMTKRMLLVGQMELGRQKGLHWLHLVPSTIYGPGYHTDGREPHFVYDLARKIVRCRRFDEDVVLWGDGNQRRELVHVDEVVPAVQALSDRADRQIVNLGAGEDHSIRDIAKELCALVGIPFDRVRFDPERFVGAERKVLATERIDGLLPDRHRVPLRQGLAQVVEWAEEYVEAVEQRT